MVSFLLKSSIIMFLLLMVYHLLMERETMHRFSRYYLLAALLVSLVAPFISFEMQQLPIPALSEVMNNQPEVLETSAVAVAPVASAVHADEAASQSSSFDWSEVIWAIYLTVSLVLLVRLVLNLMQLFQKVRSGDKSPRAEATLVLLHEPVSPFSFLRFIFISADEYRQGHIRPELLAHELTHVRQRHTIDVLLVELLQVVLWFNPLVYLYKRAIKTNHEFLADGHVINHYKNANDYQHLLLDMIFRKNTPSLVSNIGFSLTKKRLIMMTKKTSKRKLLALKLAVVPIVALVVFVFCFRSSNPALAQSQKVTELTPISIPKAMPKIRIKDLRYEDGRVFVLDREGKKHVLGAYKEMSSQNQYFFRQTLKPIKREEPTAAQLFKWRKTSKYDLWIDDVQQTDNNIIKKYKPSDLCIEWAYSRYSNADIGKHKDKQYDVHLMTNAYYEKDCRDKERKLKELLK